LPRIKGSPRERKQRRNKWAAVIPAQGSRRGLKAPPQPRVAEHLCGASGEEKQSGRQDFGGLSGSETLSDAAGVVLACRLWQSRGATLRRGSLRGCSGVTADRHSVPWLTSYEPGGTQPAGRELRGCGGLRSVRAGAGLPGSWADRSPHPHLAHTVLPWLMCFRAAPALLGSVPPTQGCCAGQSVTPQGR